MGVHENAPGRTTLAQVALARRYQSASRYAPLPGPCVPFCAHALPGPGPRSLTVPSRRPAAFMAPADTPCIRGRLMERPGIAASRVDEGGSLRTRESTNQRELRFRARPSDGTVELRQV